MSPKTSMTDCLPAAAAWPWVPAKPAAAQPWFVVLLLGLGLLQSGIHACSVVVGHSLPEWHDLRCRTWSYLPGPLHLLISNS